MVENRRFSVGRTAVGCAPQYRNGSLWELLVGVQLHRMQDWVRGLLARIGLVVLAAPNRGELLEGLEIAALALQANTFDATAADELAARRDAAVSQAAALSPSPFRGQADAGERRRHDVIGVTAAV